MVREIQKKNTKTLGRWEKEKKPNTLNEKKRKKEIISLYYYTNIKEESILSAFYYSILVR